MDPKYIIPYHRIMFSESLMPEPRTPTHTKHTRTHRGGAQNRTESQQGIEQPPPPAAGEKLLNIPESGMLLIIRHKQAAYSSTYRLVGSASVHGGLH